MNSKIAFLSLVTASAVLLGCKETDLSSAVDATDLVTDKSNATTWVVGVGMEQSRFAGACPGAELDAKRMTSLLSSYTPHVKLFLNEQATKETVRAAMLEAAANAELFIFYYSGHGGQQRFWDTGSDEEDGKDEFLCLYDTYMRDNEIWSVIQKSRGRVFCIFDACHSCTMFKVPTPVTLRRPAVFSATHNLSGGVNLLVWSGCPDNTYSYGSSTGGQMTNTLLKYFNSGKTYDTLWGQIESDGWLKGYEQVQRTIIGSGFSARPVFQ